MITFIKSFTVLLTIIFCGGCTNTNAPVVGGGTPVVAFSKTYLFGDETKVTDFICSDDGNFYVIGSVMTGNVRNALMMKVDPVGNLIWRKDYNEGGVNIFKSIKRTRDGRYIVIGDVGINNNFRIGLLQFDASGELIWQKFIDDSEIKSVEGVIEDPLGGYILLCHADYYYRKIVLIRTDNSGNQIWKKEYGSPIWNLIQSISLTDDNGVICIGQASGWIKTKKDDIWIFKIDLNGNILWNKYIDTTSFGGIHTLTRCSDGTFMILCTSYDSSNSYSELWMVKISSNGEILYEKKISPTIDCSIYDIVQVHDGNFVMVGGSNATNPLPEHAIVLKVDASGNILSQLKIGVNQADYLAHIIELPSKQFIACGTALIGNKVNGWLVGIDFNRCNQPVKTK